MPTNVAVLIMLVAHTFDAWTADAVRSTEAFRRVLILGGFVTPLFLWLAGIASVLSAERTFRRYWQPDAKRALSIFRRGVEIFILAFLFSSSGVSSSALALRSSHSSGQTSFNVMGRRSRRPVSFEEG